MKLYLSTIQFLQNFFLSISILMLLLLPPMIVFTDGGFSEQTTLMLYNISHIAVVFVMLIRPLADIFFITRWIRPLVILRKGVGVLSASIVVSFIFSKIIMDAQGYFAAFLTAKYWSMTNYALLAHLADISAIILLITSNNFSKRILGLWWKRIQKLSYVFFYASSLYVYLSLGDTKLLYSMTAVTIATLIAFIQNSKRRQASLSV